MKVEEYKYANTKADTQWVILKRITTGTTLDNIHGIICKDNMLGKLFHSIERGFKFFKAKKEWVEKRVKEQTHRGGLPNHNQWKSDSSQITTNKEDTIKLGYSTSGNETNDENIHTLNSLKKV
jgi:hypothetical protein